MNQRASSRFREKKNKRFITIATIFSICILSALLIGYQFGKYASDLKLSSLPAVPATAADTVQKSSMVAIAKTENKNVAIETKKGSLNLEKATNSTIGSVDETKVDPEPYQSPDVPPQPTVHPHEWLGGSDNYNAVLSENFKLLDEMRYSMEDEGVPDEDIEAMLLIPEDPSDDSEGVMENADISAEEIEAEILASFSDAEVPQEDAEAMLWDLTHIMSGDENNIEEPSPPQDHNP